MNASTHHEAATHDDSPSAAPARRGCRGCGLAGSLRAWGKCGTCSEAMMHILDRSFEDPMAVEEHGVAPLAGGIVQHGYQCGLLWGATMAAGARARRVLGEGRAAEAAAVTAAQRLDAAFHEQNGSSDCADITHVDWKEMMDKPVKMALYFLKGGPVTCVGMTVRYAPVAFDIIDTALSEAQVERACSPASCASELVRRAGLSEEDAAMAAGLAGGIGLSGGGCGALAAAVWIVGMEFAEEGMDYMAINDKASEVVQRFLEASDYELECAAIVGRKFEDVDDHAAWLQDGGCASLIEALSHAVRETCHREREALTA